MRSGFGLILVATCVAGCKDTSGTTTTGGSSAGAPSSSAGNGSTSGSSTPAPTGLPPQTVGSAPDCSTFSVADIEGIWGAGVQPPAPGGSNKVRELTGPGTMLWSCKYEYADDNGLAVTIEYRVYSDEAAAKSSFSGAVSGETSLSRRAPEQMALGEEAFVGAPSPKDVQRQIYVRKGRVVFLLGAFNSKGAQPDFTDKLAKTYKLKL